MATLPARVLAWSSGLQADVMSVYSLGGPADLSSPATKAIIEAAPDDFVGLLGGVVTQVPEADREKIETFIDVLTAATDAVPVLCRKLVARATVAAIRAEKPKPDTVIFKAIDRGDADVMTALEGAGLSSEDYRDALLAFFDLAKITALTALATPPTPTPAPAAGGGGGGGTGSHGGGSHAPPPATPPVDGFEVMTSKGWVYFIVFVVAPFVVGAVMVIASGVFTLLAMLFGPIVFSQLEFMALTSAVPTLVVLTVPTFLLPAGAFLIFISRLFGTPLDARYWRDHGMNPDWAIAAFTTANMAASGIAIACVILLALVGVINLPLAIALGFLSGLALVAAILFIIAWGDSVRKYYLIDHEHGQSVRDSLRAAMMQSGMAIFYVGAGVSLVLMVVFGLAVKPVWGYYPPELIVVARATEIVVEERSDCQARIEVLKEVAAEWNKENGYEGNDFVEMCVSTDDEAIDAECKAFTAKCS